MRWADNGSNSNPKFHEEVEFEEDEDEDDLEELGEIDEFVL